MGGREDECVRNGEWEGGRMSVCAKVSASGGRMSVCAMASGREGQGEWVRLRGSRGGCTVQYLSTNKW